MCESFDIIKMNSEKLRALWKTKVSKNLKSDKRWDKSRLERSIKGAHLEYILIEVPVEKRSILVFKTLHRWNFQIINHEQLILFNIDSWIKRGHGSRNTKTRTREQHRNQGPQEASWRIWRSRRGDRHRGFLPWEGVHQTDENQLDNNFLRDAGQRWIASGDAGADPRRRGRRAPYGIAFHVNSFLWSR